MFCIPESNGFKERKEWQKSMKRMSNNTWETYQKLESKKCFVKKILLITVKVSKNMIYLHNLMIRPVSMQNKIRILKKIKNNRKNKQPKKK